MTGKSYLGAREAIQNHHRRASVAQPAVKEQLPVTYVDLFLVILSLKNGKKYEESARQGCRDPGDGSGVSEELSRGSRPRGVKAALVHVHPC